MVEQLLESRDEADQVGPVRSFTRFYTTVIGVLGEGLLDTPYSLAEARVIFELAQRAANDVADLRRDLDIDAGYLSKILTRLQAAGLVTRERSEVDRRRQVVRLSARGREVFRTLDERSAAQVRDLLSGLTEEERRRLVGAMGAIRQILERPGEPRPFVLRPLGPGDHGWVVQRHGALYAEEYGWDERFEELVARIVADHIRDRRPGRDEAWIAEVDGEPVGCVFCVEKDEETAQLRLLLVEPRARGMGIGSRLIEECLRFARRAGYRRIMLWTNDVLDDARRLYERAGFEMVEAEPHHSFGRDLVGQTWERTL